MKQLQQLSKGASPQHCAREILDLVPHIMLTIRTEMRRGRRRDLSVPQFRALAYLTHFPNASLSQLAENLGLTPPSASKIVDNLVTRELIARRAATDDRRRIRLSVTPAGRERFDTARQATQARLAEMLGALSESQRAGVIEAMHSLRPIFAPR